MQQDIFSILKKEKKHLHSAFGVEEIGVFGSYARGNATPQSDVDILVTFSRPSFNALMDTYLYLEKILKKKIDLVTKHKRLSKRFLGIIEQDIVYV